MGLHFRNQRLHKRQIKIGSAIFFISMVVIFQNGRQHIHVLELPCLINVEKRSWCLNIHFQDQGLGRAI